MQLQDLQCDEEQSRNPDYFIKSTIYDCLSDAQYGINKSHSLTKKLDYSEHHNLRWFLKTKIIFYNYFSKIKSDLKLI